MNNPQEYCPDDSVCYECGKSIPDDWQKAPNSIKPYVFYGFCSLECDKEYHNRAGHRVKVQSGASRIVRIGDYVAYREPNKDSPQYASGQLRKVIGFDYPSAYTSYYENYSRWPGIIVQGRLGRKIGPKKYADGAMVGPLFPEDIAEVIDNNER